MEYCGDCGGTVAPCTEQDYANDTAVWGNCDASADCKTCGNGLDHQPLGCYCSERFADGETRSPTATKNDPTSICDQKAGQADCGNICAYSNCPSFNSHKKSCKIPAVVCTSVSIGGKSCLQSNVLTVDDHCVAGPPHYDSEGMVCAYDGTAREAYCSYGVSATACARCNSQNEFTNERQLAILELEIGEICGIVLLALCIAALLIRYCQNTRSTSLTPAAVEGVALSKAPVRDGI
jgi:hypothetical protein